MERKIQREYPIFEQLSTEELEKLLAQDFAAADGEEPDVDYIMAIMGVINEREKAAGRQTDVDAAWKDFQNEYQGRAAAFDRTIPSEAESSDHHQSSPAQTAHRKTRVFRFVLVAAVIVVLLCGTAAGFDRVFQAVVNWTAETFGFESPYREEVPAEDLIQFDPYADLRKAVLEYTDLSLIPHWAPENTLKDPEIDVRITERSNMTQLSGIYDTDNGRFVIRIRIHDELPTDYHGEYQWNESEIVTIHTVNEIGHDIVQNNKNNTAAWTNENVECMIQGDLSVDELEQMIDSIYEE